MSQITEIFRRIISQSLYRRATWKREVAEVRRCCEDFKSRSSEDIEKIANRLRTVLMREQDMSVQPPWQRLREAVSLAIRAVEGTRSIRLHDVQIFGVLCICRGMATEIQTGEGKSVVAAVAAISLAILGRRTHIATTNNYLAFRDYQEFLVSASQVGISMGCIDGSQTPQLKSSQYKCDIVYGAGFQFGFDYLRQQSELSKRSRRAVGQYTLDALRYETSESWTAELSPFVLADVVIVDEADSVLIDEAMSPLVLSEVQGEAQDSLLLREADRVALNLQMGVDFRLTAQGTIEWINGHHTRPSSQIATDRNFESDSIPENNTHARRTWSGYLLNALKAHHCLTNGVQYVVKDSRVCVVDTSTGRLHPERLFQNGLHEAIEIKEGLVPTGKSKILARVTRQAFFRKYPLLAGMSGTLTPVMQEIRTLFRAPYVSVPENSPSRRIHLPTRLFRDKEAKHRAISEDSIQRIKRKQPVLIGTRSIRESQQLFERFSRLGVEATLLNGVQDEDESNVIKKAGMPGVLTIATNMAGRGTHIPIPPAVEEYGGLHVVVSEPNLNARSDRQLIGRTARQGRHGSCQVFVSCDDQIMEWSRPTELRRLQNTFNKLGESHVQLEDQIERMQLVCEKQAKNTRLRMIQSEEWFSRVKRKLV